VSAFYEGDLVLGIMTIGPVTEGHAMVLPKKHVAYLADLDEASWRHVSVIAQRTASAIRASGIRCEGINFFLADGEAASQEICQWSLCSDASLEIDGAPFSVWDWRQVSHVVGNGYCCNKQKSK